MTEQIIKWYNKNKRDLPWRDNKDPYIIWVSEIILQQTQIKTGIPYFKKFIKKFPNIESLANSQEKELLKIWEGLGYYNRALNMLETAKIIVFNLNNIFPNKYQDLLKLKGIGSYTAAAISSICFDQKIGVVDGNVYRVLTRYYNIEDPINQIGTKRKIQEIANKLVTHKKPGLYNQAIMDFGSIQCKKHEPKCDICPLKNKCKSFKANTVKFRPVKSNKKYQKKRYLNYFICCNKKKIIINQRDSSNIWKKLYELPLIETNKEYSTIEALQNDYFKNKKVSKMQLLQKMTHHLSHQKLIISFWLIESQLNEPILNQKMIHISEIQNFPFPKPIQKFLQLFFNK